MFKQYTILVNYNKNLCRLNCLEKMNNNSFAVVSLDSLHKYSLEKVINPQKNIQHQQINIFLELVEEEIENSFLEWFPSLEEAIDNFLNNEW